jgi:rRNA-processing protein FCF1
VHEDEISGVISAIHVVVEGAARRAAIPAPITTVVATGQGDDAVVTTVRTLSTTGQPMVVVTSDRELGRRVAEANGDLHLRGPRWLLNL